MLTFSPDHILPATLQAAESVNSQYGLGIELGRLVLVTDDIPGLTPAARFEPYTQPDHLVLVQQLVVTDDDVCAVFTLDLHASDSARFLAQNVESGLPIVLVCPERGRARVVLVPLIADMADGAAEAAQYFARLEVPPLSAQAYLSMLGDIGAGTAQLLSRTMGLDGVSMQFHLRPVLGTEHLACLGDETLASFVARPDEAPMLSRLLGTTYLGSGSLVELLALAHALDEPKR